MPLLRYKLQTPTPRNQAVFDFLCEMLGVTGQMVENDYQLYYGTLTDEIESAAWIIPFNETDILWHDLLKNNHVPQAGRTIPFDLINGIDAFLSDTIHQDSPDTAFDRHDRLKYEASFAVQAGYGELPIVNIYVDFLRRLLKLDGLPLWKDGKRCAVGLSHDVDRLHNGFFARMVTFARSIARQKKIPSIQKILRSDDFVLLRQVMDMETQYGFSSTFFFVGMPFRSGYRSMYDVLYDIQDFPDLLQEVRKRGFGVGLHASYNAYQHAEYFAAERERLAQYSSGEVIGLRHHFWHMVRDSALPLHEEAGFQYDASVAFNEHLGFRRGVALPFFPWNGERPLTVLQLPTFCMDGHLFYKPRPVDAALEQIKASLETLKQIGGLAVIDWHSDTANPNSPYYDESWGICYQKLLETLAADSDVWVTNLETITTWLKNRKQTLYNVHEF